MKNWIWKVKVESKKKLQQLVKRFLNYWILDASYYTSELSSLVKEMNFLEKRKENATKRILELFSLSWSLSPAQEKFKKDLLEKIEDVYSLEKNKDVLKEFLLNLDWKSKSVKINYCLYTISYNKGNCMYDFETWINTEYENIQFKTIESIIEEIKIRENLGKWCIIKFFKELTDKELLEDNWFTIYCESPLEIWDENWNNAKWKCVDLVLDALRNKK